MVCQNLKSHHIQGRTKTFIVEAIIKLMHCGNLANFDKLLSCLIIILHSKEENDLLIESFQILDLDPANISEDFEVPNVENICDELDEHAFRSNLPLHETPFHKHCQKLYWAILEKHGDLLISPDKAQSKQKTKGAKVLADGVKDPNKLNSFLCILFMDSIFFENFYAALLAMWTNIFDCLRGAYDKEYVATSADVEGYFNLKKNVIHPDRPLKPWRFIERDRRHVMNSAKAIFMEIRTDGKEFDEDDPGINDEKEKAKNEGSANGDTQYEDDENEVDNPEPDRTLDVSATAHDEWDNRAKKPKFSYSQGTVINKHAKRLSVGNKTEQWNRSPKNARKPSQAALAGRFSQRSSFRRQSSHDFDIPNSNLNPVSNKKVQPTSTPIKKSSEPKPSFDLSAITNQIKVQESPEKKATKRKSLSLSKSSGKRRISKEQKDESMPKPQAVPTDDEDIIFGADEDLLVEEEIQTSQYAFCRPDLHFPTGIPYANLLNEIKIETISLETDNNVSALFG